jgi:hypothetical protein
LADTGAKVPAFGADTRYLAAAIACTRSEPACRNPITVYLRRGERNVEVVGIDR